MKKGFTLIELLAVIIIVGILIVIVIPPIMKNVDEARNNAHNQVITNIKEATQLYIRENKQYIEGINQTGNTITITLQDLVDANNLEEPINDPLKDKEISLTTTILIHVLPKAKYEVTVSDFIYK